MRQLYGWLIYALGLGAASTFALALYLLLTAHMGYVHAEVGKWLLTVAAAFVLTGVLSVGVKQIDQRRSEREAWHAVLKDLVAASQTVLVARLRLRAQQSALTYQEQLAELSRVRVELRGIEATGLVIGEKSLQEDISKMRRYLEALGSEYEAGYLRVARQQRLDELWLAERMKAANI